VLSCTSIIIGCTKDVTVGRKYVTSYCHSPPASAEVKMVELKLYSPIRLHGMVLEFEEN
jgi:hypothetical protein